MIARVDYGFLFFVLETLGCQKSGKEEKKSLVITENLTIPVIDKQVIVRYTCSNFN